MKNFKVVVGVFSFVMGMVTFSLWKKFNYVSIPKENMQRSVASEGTGQQQIIDNFNEIILSIKSQADLEKARLEIIEKAKPYPQFVGVQLYASVAQALPGFKGLAWRLRGVVEETDITHSMILSNLRFFYMSRYAYGPHIRTLFHYIVDPAEGTSQFKKISDVQDFLQQKVKPVLQHMLKQSEQSLELSPTLHHFKFDRRLFFGASDDKRFFDPEEAQKEFIKPYMSYVISGLARTIAFIDYGSVYNMDDIPTVMRSVLKRSAINSIKSRFKIKPWRKTHKNEVKSLPNIMSRKEVSSIILGFRNLGKPRKGVKNHQVLLDNAYKMVALAAEHDLKGYVCSISYVNSMMNKVSIDAKYDCSHDFMEAENFREEELFVVGGSHFLVDPNQLLINHRQKFHELRDRYRMYHPENEDGNVDITSDATGAIVRINMKNAFQVQRDLKRYLPVSFETSINHDGVSINNDVGTYNERGQWMWNYDYGRPTAWQGDAVKFGGLFPDATNENIYDIMYSVRLTRSLRPLSNLFTTVP